VERRAELTLNPITPAFRDEEMLMSVAPAK
jgi:hypothetical protein